MTMEGLGTFLQHNPLAQVRPGLGERLGGEDGQVDPCLGGSACFGVDD